MTGDVNKRGKSHSKDVKSRALRIFENSIRSEYTRKQYFYQLQRFIKYYKLKNMESILRIDQKRLQIMMEDYVLYLKTKLSPNSFDAPLGALQSFLDINDIFLNWKKIRKLVPARVKKSGERGYTTQEIQKMLEFTSDKRTKAIIHFIASSGVRIGAFDGLKLKNVVEMTLGCKAVQVYEGSTEEYWTFLIPEASKALDDYINERRKDGEAITPESPVFRARYSVGRGKAKPLSISSVIQVIYRVLKKAGLRENLKNNRYEVQLDHGFRKRFNTILKLNREINPNIVEKIMGHSKGLDGVYLKPTRQESFEEYTKAIIDLTIDQSEQLKAKNQQQEKSIQKHKEDEYKFEKLSADYFNFKHRSEAREAHFDKIVLDAKRQNERAMAMIARLFQLTFEADGDEEAKKKKWAEYLSAMDEGRAVDLENMLELKPKSFNDKIQQIMLAAKLDLRAN